MVQSEQKANEIIKHANETAKQIIADAAGKQLERHAPKIKVDPETQERFRQDLEALQRNLEKEVSEAVSHLDSATESVQTAKDKMENLTITTKGTPSVTEATKKYKKAIKKFLKREVQWQNIILQQNN